MVARPRGGLRSDLIHRPGEGTSLREGWCRDPPENLEPSPLSRRGSKSNVVPSASILCMITTSLRASATLAFFMPARLASFMAQLLRADPLTGLVRMTWAASNRAVRTPLSPFFDIRPV